MPLTLTVLAEVFGNTPTSAPGRKTLRSLVCSVITELVELHYSHTHTHSYLFYWDKSHMNRTLCSPSSPASTKSLSVIDLLSVVFPFISLSHSLPLSNFFSLQLFSVTESIAFLASIWSRNSWIWTELLQIEIKYYVLPGSRVFSQEGKPEAGWLSNHTEFSMAVSPLGLGLALETLLCPLDVALCSHLAL